jgi:hypothetical protein
VDSHKPTCTNHTLFEAIADSRKPTSNFFVRLVGLDIWWLSPRRFRDPQEAKHSALELLNIKKDGAARHGGHVNWQARETRRTWCARCSRRQRPSWWCCPTSTAPLHSCNLCSCLCSATTMSHTSSHEFNMSASLQYPRQSRSGSGASWLSNGIAP